MTQNYSNFRTILLNNKFEVFEFFLYKKDYIRTRGSDFNLENNDSIVLHDRKLRTSAA